MIQLSKNLSTISLAQRLFKKILSSKSHSLDFSNVEIVSRSFANEFVNLEKEKKVRIEKLNLSSENQYVFDIADKPLDNNILSKNKLQLSNLDSISNSQI
jgi:hypothetical protein